MQRLGFSFHIDDVECGFVVDKVMKKRLALSICFSLIVSHGNAAFTNQAIMEMRSTGGSNLNSGVFDRGVAVPGVDYSQQDSSQANGTNMASLNGTSNPCTVTSVTRVFGIDDEGNSITISAGSNWSVSVYVITDTDGLGGAVLDKACGSAATLTNGTWREGGSYPGGNSTAGISDDARFELMPASSTVYVKNGTYVLNQVGIGAAGTSVARTSIIGYDSTRGDNPTDSARPLFSMGANSFTIGSFWDFCYMRMTGSAAQLFSSGSGSIVSFCKFTNTSPIVGRVAVSIAASAMFMANEVISFRGIGATSSAVTSMINNYVHDSDVLVRRSNNDTSDWVMLGNILEGGASFGLQVTQNPTGLFMLINNTIYGSENKRGILVGFAATTRPTMNNNILYGGITASSSATLGLNYYDNYNDYFNNTTDTFNWTKGANDTSTNPAFTNVSQITGTTGAFVAGNNRLVDTSKNFSSLGVVAGDCVMITAGTGVAVSSYSFLIDALSTTTNPNDTLNITVPSGPGTDTTADKVYEITIGHNYLPTATLSAYPGSFPGGFSTGYLTIGAVQKQAGSAAATTSFGFIGN